MELRLHLYSKGVRLLLGSFLYGVFHVAGPGHGKFVVMSWLSTHPENQHTARVIPFIGSLMQGVTAILFVYVLAICLKLTTGDLSLSRWYIDNLSAGFIAVFGVYVMKQAYRSMQPKQLKINAVLPTTHVHSEHCGCHHLPTHEIKSSDSWRTRLGIVFSIGMRPCSGAIMILVFSNAMGVVSWGVAAVMIMAIGTGLSILALTYAVQFAQQTTIRWYGSSNKRQRNYLPFLKMACGVLLIIFAVILFCTVIPVSTNGDYIAAGC